MTTSMGSILVVDDDLLNRVLLSTNLSDAGYAVEMAQDGYQALDMLKERAFDLVLLDLIMPRMDGFEVLEQIKADGAMRHIPVIVVSATDEMESIARCIEIGATDHLSKPFNPILLHARINASLAMKRLHDQEMEYRNNIEDYNRQLESRVQEQVSQLQESFARLQRSLEGAVVALSSTVERRDPYTAGHQQRVSQLGCAIGREMGLTENEIEGIRVGGILHDAGKIAVPIEILCKPGRISDAEFALIKTHAQAGYEILKTIEFPWPIAEMALQHHERMNGKGYPGGLAGDQILLEARIIGVADVVEAMAAHRPYRPSLGTDKALAEIAQNRGTHYDPAVADACIALFERHAFEFH